YVASATSSNGGGSAGAARRPTIRYATAMARAAQRSPSDGPPEGDEDAELLAMLPKSRSTHDAGTSRVVGPSSRRRSQHRRSLTPAVGGASGPSASSELLPPAVHLEVRPDRPGSRPVRHHERETLQSKPRDATSRS